MTHDNCGNCASGEPCRLHRVVADGTVVRVPLTMMDSMQRQLADRAANDAPQDQPYAAAIRDCETKKATIDAHADHWREKFAAQEEWKSHDPAYQACQNARD